jgi:hypothetical protein
VERNILHSNRFTSFSLHFVRLPPPDIMLQPRRSGAALVFAFRSLPLVLWFSLSLEHESCSLTKQQPPRGVCCFIVKEFSLWCHPDLSPQQQPHHRTVRRRVRSYQPSQQAALRITARQGALPILPSSSNASSLRRSIPANSLSCVTLR